MQIQKWVPTTVTIISLKLIGSNFIAPLFIVTEFFIQKNSIHTIHEQGFQRIKTRIVYIAILMAYIMAF